MNPLDRKAYITPGQFTQDPLVLLLCDAYKTGHVFQQPLKTETFFENLTARSHTYFTSELEFDGAVFFGLQRLLLRWLVGSFQTFFDKPWDEINAEYLAYMDGVLGKGVVTTEHLKALHTLGYLPLEIRAVPEGTIVPTRVPCMTIENTVDGFAWLAGYFEDLWSNELWKPCTVATIALHYRRTLEHFAAKTGASREWVDYQSHNFALRGMAGMMDDANSSTGHLVFFKGTDSFPSVWSANTFYNLLGEMPISEIAGSIPATEHSVTCANIAVLAEQYRAHIPAEGEEPYSEDEILALAERDYMTHLLTEVYPSGPFSFVSDTNDFWDTITNKAVANKDAILARDGKIVFRPDSGDPVRIVAGYRHSDVDWPTKDVEFDAVFDDEQNSEAICVLGEWYLIDRYIDLYGDKAASIDWDRPVPKHIVDGAVVTLANNFGYTTNAAGFKTMSEKVGLIYGDAITLARMTEILQRMLDKGYASDNVVYGVGSYTYQYMTRDTMGIAMKATAAKVDGKHYSLSKSPKTDDGTKKSAKGYLIVMRDDSGRLYLRDNLTREEYLALRGSDDDCMRTYYKDGELMTLESLRTIRTRAHGQINDDLYYVTGVAEDEEGDCYLTEDQFASFWSICSRVDAHRDSVLGNYGSRTEAECAMASLPRR